MENDCCNMLLQAAPTRASVSQSECQVALESQDSESTPQLLPLPRPAHETPAAPPHCAQEQCQVDNLAASIGTVVSLGHGLHDDSAPGDEAAASHDSAAVTAPCIDPGQAQNISQELPFAEPKDVGPVTAHLPLPAAPAADRSPVQQQGLAACLRAANAPAEVPAPTASTVSHSHGHSHSRNTSAGSTPIKLLSGLSTATSTAYCKAVASCYSLPSKESAILG